MSDPAAQVLVPVKLRYGNAGFMKQELVGDSSVSRSTRPGLRRSYVLQRGSFAHHPVGEFVEQKTCSETKMPPNWKIKVDLVLYR